jgi:hypothetical protein
MASRVSVTRRSCRRAIFATLLVETVLAEPPAGARSRRRAAQRPRRDPNTRSCSCSGARWRAGFRRPVSSLVAPEAGEYVTSPRYAGMFADGDVARRGAGAFLARPLRYAGLPPRRGVRDAAGRLCGKCRGRGADLRAGLRHRAGERPLPRRSPRCHGGGSDGGGGRAWGRIDAFAGDGDHGQGMRRAARLRPATPSIRPWRMVPVRKARLPRPAMPGRIGPAEPPAPSGACCYAPGARLFPTRRPCRMRISRAAPASRWRT